MTTSGQTWKDMTGLGGICSAPQVSREALCRMQNFLSRFYNPSPPISYSFLPTSQEILSMDKPRCAASPGGPGGQHRDAGKFLPCPGMPPRRVLGVARGGPVAAGHGRAGHATRSHQREPKGRGSWAARGGKRGLSPPPCGLQMPPNLLPASTHPGEKPRVSVPPWVIPVPGGCTLCQSSAPSQAPVKGI